MRREPRRDAPLRGQRGLVSRQDLQCGQRQRSSEAIRRQQRVRSDEQRVAWR